LITRFKNGKFVLRGLYYYQLSPNVIEKDNPSWLSYTATYTFNSDGLNDRYDYEIPKPEDVYRIVTLGDSFTFGFFVNTVDSWPEQLEDMFVQNSNFCNARNVEVINLGMGGFDIPYIIERYKNVGDKYRPNLILWFESGSGFFRINELIQPLINECKAASTQGVNSEYSLVAKQEYYRCWIEAEKQIREELTESGITSQLTPYWDNFFQTVDPKRVFYLSFKSIPGNNDYANPWNFWQKRYHESNFLAIIEDLEPDLTAFIVFWQCSRQKI